MHDARAQTLADALVRDLVRGQLDAAQFVSGKNRIWLVRRTREFCPPHETEERTVSLLDRMEDQVRMTYQATRDRALATLAAAAPAQAEPADAG